MPRRVRNARQPLGEQPFHALTRSTRRSRTGRANSRPQGTITQNSGLDRVLKRRNPAFSGFEKLSPEWFERHVILRKTVKELVALGSMPASEHTDVDTVTKYEQLITALERPLTNAEAQAL